MRLRQWLTEGRITRKDRKTISQIIINPETGNFELEDNTQIEVKVGRNTTQLMFDKNNDELIMTLTEMCDSLGYQFDYEEKGNQVVFEIQT